MTHYARIAITGKVDRVIVANRAFIESLPDSALWLETSMHDASIRKNYAGIGYIYDAQRDAFIPPKPSPDAILNEATCLWEINDADTKSDA